jgi:ribose transport system substrate-binding protein
VTSGTHLAQFLVDELGGKGKIVMITGVPGTTVDADLQGGANAVFAKNPGIEVIAKANGMWSEPGARSELQKILATRSWDTIDGLWMETGCYTAAAMQMEAGIADDKIKPCASPSSNGQQVQMLPKDSADGTGPYRSFGYRSASASVPAMLGAYALKLAVEVLDGQTVPRETIVDVPTITYKNSKLCQDGTWKEMQDGCTAFAPSLVPPEFYSSIFNPNTPEVALNAALLGEPEQTN